MINDPTLESQFTNLQGKKLNPILLNWEEETSKRRQKYFEEIIEQGKFTHCKHANKKISALESNETYKICLANVREEIEEEDDPELRSELLKKLTNILSKGKSDKDRLENLNHFRQEIADGNIE